VLAGEGCDVVSPPNQGCCGALSVHNGRAEEAQRFAAALTETFERAGVDYVVVNAAGCGSAAKEYLPNARDFAELLADLGPVAPRHPLPLTVAYHDACHLAHAQGIRAQPRALLASIPSLVVREITDPEICCGSAGIWNVLNPEPAHELGERKARDVLATGADVLVTANPGCLMQIGAFVRGRMRLAHTAQVLDASINNRPLASVR
jgi:glycolate oxidase iron-sulfur subunit